MKLIAETAWHHQGDIDFLEVLVRDLVNNSRADYLKFHITIDLDEYMAKTHPLYNKLNEWVIDEKSWRRILESIKGMKGLMLLFNDTRSVEMGMLYNPDLIEIHSACLNDFRLLDCLKQNIENKTKIVLGVGGSTLFEIETAINRLETSKIVLMFGFQNYPTIYSDINFLKMRKIMTLFPNFEFGYADHTSWDEPQNSLITLFGASLGMQYIEKHVSTQPGVERADYQSAISINTFNDLHKKLQLLSECQGDGLLKLNPAELKSTQPGLIKKAAILNRKVNTNDMLCEDMIIFKRTELSSDLTQVDIISLLGRKFTRVLPKNIVLMRDMLTI